MKREELGERIYEAGIHQPDSEEVGYEVLSSNEPWGRTFTSVNQLSFKS